MPIAENSVVAFHYALTNDAGEELDSSAGREPLSFLFGHGGIIPGLEAEFADREIGDTFKATITKAELIEASSADYIFSSSPGCVHRDAQLINSFIDSQSLPSLLGTSLE